MAQKKIDDETPPAPRKSNPKFWAFIAILIAYAGFLWLWAKVMHPPK